MNFKVFPCDAFKRPLINEWQDLATNDAQVLSQWQQAYGPKLAYWGVPTGKANNILALDVDTKDDNGFQTLSLPEHSIQPTYQQSTPSGGAHFIFEYPNDGETYGNKVKFKPGLDIRGEGGYICWYGLNVANDGTFAPAPDWIKKPARKTPVIQGETYVASPGATQDLINEACNLVINAPEGESNNVLNTQAFRLGQLVASQGVTRDYAFNVLFDAAKKRGKPDYEARATINSGLDGGSKKPETLPFTAPTPDLTAIVPEIPKPETWEPSYISPQEALNFKKLRKPQLFKDWSTEDIHLTTADGGTGKTTLKLYEAVCLALGERFLGFECKSGPSKTIFITGEDSAAKLKAMVGQICKQMGLTEPDQKHKFSQVLSSIEVRAPGEFVIVNKDRQGFYHPSTQSLNLMLDLCKKVQPKMIVFDPISMFWGSEAGLNDMAKAVSRFMGQLVNETGACVEMINHMGKQSSGSKDLSQFAGRGGTGLPSHSRVNRTLRPVFDEEYADLTGEQLEDNQSAMLCNVNKFSDGSPLLQKPFIILRTGHLFERIEIQSMSKQDDIKKSNDAERVYKFIEEMRLAKKWPTEGGVIGFFMSNKDKLSQTRVKHAIQVLGMVGHEGYYVKKIDHPESPDEKALTIMDSTGREL